MHRGNESCCAQGRGKREIHFNNNAAMPTGVAQLSSYYAIGDYRGTASIRLAPPPASQTAVANPSQTTLVRAPTATIGSGSIPMTSQSTPRSRDFSQGIRVGVGAGVGASLAIVSVALILCFIWNRRREQHRAIVFVTENGDTAKRSELGSDWVGEMDAGLPPPPPLKEIDDIRGSKSSCRVQEMPAVT